MSIYLTTAETKMKEIVQGLNMTFLAMTVQEANLELDKLKENDPWPVFIYVKPVKQKNTQTAPNTVQRKTPVFGFLMGRVMQSTNDRPAQTLVDVIQNCRYMVDKVVKQLNAASITATDSEGKDGIKDWSTTEAYDEFDANVHGVTFEFDWPVIDLLACS